MERISVVPPQVDAASLSEEESLEENVVSAQQSNPIVEMSEGEVKKVILPQGKTLRLLALDLFGNREFWVYIYLQNKDKIPNPNRVPSGIELVLPDKSIYFINAADSQSVLKAKSLGTEILRTL
ncbi:hypothetical protein [Proteiniphilum sp.]|uniref:LysM peptidoglycan-binding domain-containing protein n=1 Tax=Proteiniphilum sp. TaxID=1926877 RepID=UPI002B1EBDF6|nr:hypothetical protein [Proteiniphilum sp.]MEA4919151.1 hypothetical protein [Proteiniphilum sp.]